VLWQVIPTNYLTINLNNEKTKVIDIEIIKTVSLFVVEIVSDVRGVSEFGQGVGVVIVKDWQESSVRKDATIREADDIG
jgi:hypothetical protein